MRKKGEVNYLDFIPVKSTKYAYTYDQNDIAVIIVPHKTIYDKFAQKLFKTPAESKISLDKYGSFVWKLIDSKNSIYDISIEVKNKFGDEAEPLYNRLIKYFQILEDQRFVKIQKENKKC